MILVFFVRVNLYRGVHVHITIFFGGQKGARRVTRPLYVSYEDEALVEGHDMPAGEAAAAATDTDDRNAASVVDPR